MTWRPDYKRDVGPRLRRAANCIGEGPPRHQLIQAVLAIHVLRDDEFPADFRTQFREIIGQATVGHTSSIEEGIGRLTDDQVTALGTKIVELYTDTCGA